MIGWPRTPSIGRLRRLIEACGFELRYVMKEPPDTWSLVRQYLALSPEQHLAQLVATVRFARAGRDAMASRLGGGAAGAAALGRLSSAGGISDTDLSPARA